MDRDFGIFGDDSNRSNQFQYYYHQDKQQQAPQNQKPTSACSEICSDIFRDKASPSPRESPKDPPVPAPGPAQRSVRIIVVGTAGRLKYLSAKQGSREITNDLSINMHTLIKSFFKEFKTFENPLAVYHELIQEFLKAKPNLASIKRILRVPEGLHGDPPPEGWPMRGRELGQFIADKVCETGTVRSILRSRKMKFSNKIMVCKYLQVLRRGSEGQANLRGWKINQS